MKILILGGGNSQLTAIKRAKEKGHTVVITDYYPDPPGKRVADFTEQISTFDVAGNIAVAEKYQVDGVMTLGTDQPVYTAAKVAEALGLPGFIDTETALAVTNKKVMKEILGRHGVPLAPYRLVGEGFPASQLQGLKFPVVIKPIDSQGQRGIYKLDTLNEIYTHMQDTLSYSRAVEIMVEEFYENGEITVSGWVECGRTYLLTITDRISIQSGKHLGICTSHHFPSRFISDYYEEIKQITENIVEAVGIQEGPIYFQMLIGASGVKVNEISCRVGGAHEDEFIPALTGINILDLIMEGALGQKSDLTALRRHDMRNIREKVSVELVFARPGRTARLSETDQVKKIPGVVQAGFYVEPGHQASEITNATQRVGYMIVTAASEKELKGRLHQAYDVFRMEDEAGKNLIRREFITTY
ncbi:MAG: ATP-grasp domain-containing protein [Clostridia bacterium]|jgi:phosphoribosylamine-glycine ligase|nr:ATP-grasp domain-containing protein [Clostridia bacterium]